MPDGTTAETTGTMQCRLVGGLWLIAESSGVTPEGDEWHCVLTVGYDPTPKQYIGSFIGSMMANMWIYQGQIDASGKRLPLNTEGPAFDREGTTAYRDTIEIVDDNCWRFTGEMMSANGTWFPMMSAEHQRIG